MSYFDRFKIFGKSSETPKIEASIGGPVWRDTRWRGASRVIRSLASWFASIGSGTSDLQRMELRTLRARSRDSFRSDPIARAALTRPRANVVGTGLICRPAVLHADLGIDIDQAEEFNTMLQRRFEAWAEDPTECDAEATLDFYGNQALILMSAMLSGDCFVLTPWEQRPGGVSGLKIQLIEADRIENPENAPDTVGLIEGIVLSNIGQPVGCWIRSNHPGDALTVMQPPTWTYYPMFGENTGRRRVLHVWNDKERPGQVRGAPFLAPILEPLRQASKWSENELMAAVISAMYTVFLENDIPPPVDDTGNTISPFGGIPTSSLTENAALANASPETFAPPAAATSVAMGNGAVIDLPPGTKATFANPSRPNAQFDPFFSALVLQMGAALEIPADELLLRYQQSYTAAKASMIQAWRFYLMRRQSLSTQLCNPVYGLWLDEEVASGRISLPGYADPIRRRAWSNCLWIGPAKGAMDEVKEAQAAQMRIDMGVSNEARECAAMVGESRDAIYAQRLREINQRKADGTWLERPTQTVRYSPATSPDDAVPVGPNDPGNGVDNPENGNNEP